MTGNNLRALIDALGNVKAEIANLADRERKLKAQLVALGDGAYDGDLFRATVSTAERSTLDMDAVRAKLSPQFITANSKVTKSTTIKVVARVAERVAA